MQGASADDYTSEVSSLVRVNSGGLVDAFSLPPPSRKHVGLSAVPSCVDSSRPNPPLFPPPLLQGGTTALMWAAGFGHTAIVEALLKTVAKVDLQEKVSWPRIFALNNSAGKALHPGSLY